MVGIHTKEESWDGARTTMIIAGRRSREAGRKSSCSLLAPMGRLASEARRVQGRAEAWDRIKRSIKHNHDRPWASMGRDWRDFHGLVWLLVVSKFALTDKSADFKFSLTFLISAMHGPNLPALAWGGVLVAQM